MDLEASSVEILKFCEKGSATSTHSSGIPCSLDLTGRQVQSGRIQLSLDWSHTIGTFSSLRRGIRLVAYRSRYLDLVFLGLATNYMWQIHNHIKVPFRCSSNCSWAHRPFIPKGPRSLNRYEHRQGLKKFQCFQRHKISKMANTGSPRRQIRVNRHFNGPFANYFSPDRFCCYTTTYCWISAFCRLQRSFSFFFHNIFLLVSSYVEILIGLKSPHLF